MTSYFDFMKSAEVVEYVNQAWGVGYDTWHSITVCSILFFGIASMVVSCIIVCRMVAVLNRKFLGKRCGIKRKAWSDGDTVFEETTTKYFRKAEGEFHDYLEAADVEKKYRGLWPFASEAFECLAALGCEISIRKIR